MILLTVGDSWTQGDSPAQNINWEAKQNLDWYHIPPHFGLSYVNEKTFDKKILNKFYESEVWPKTLGRNLGLETYNAGRLGTNNKDILKTTINCIKYITENHNIKPQQIFIVIGLTSKYRDHLVEKKPNQKFSISQMNFGHLTSSDFKHISFNYFMDEFCLQTYILEKWLNDLNIKYLIFNAFEDQNDVTESTFYNINLKNWFNNSLDAHFRPYVENKFNTKWQTNGKYFQFKHPTDILHEEWGNHLTKYIQNKKIL